MATSVIPYTNKDMNYVAGRLATQQTIAANTDFEYATATISEDGKYLVIMSYGASPNESCIMALKKADGSSVANKWTSPGNSFVIGPITLKGGDSVKAIVRFSAAFTHYSDGRNNCLLLIKLAT
jgi:hypothetical protein